MQGADATVVPAVHATFTIERTLDASPARVFAAFADPVAKARWFVGPPSWERLEQRFDFRVGGREYSRGGPSGGPHSVFDALYWDIVPGRRIVYTYEMHLDASKISVSLATIELIPSGTGTLLRITEQGAFFDSPMGAAREIAAGREAGTRTLLDQLEASLRGAAGTPIRG